MFTLNRPQPVERLQALAELTLEHSLRGGEAFAASGTLARPATVHGMYRLLMPGEEASPTVYRRVTGGATWLLEAGDGYAALAAPWRGGLQGLHERLQAMGCGAAPPGYTIVEGVAFVEAAGGEPRELLACLAEALGVEAGGAVPAPRMNVAELARLYASPGWRLHRHRRGDAEARVERDGYWAVLSVEKTGPYVSWISLSGVFYAAPPSEVYSVLAAARGTRLDEMILYGLTVNLEKRVEAAGLTIDDLKNLLVEAHRAAGERFYTG